MANSTPAPFYLVIGSGYPLLVLHGGLGLDHTYLRPGLDPLADRISLVYLDFTGNGRSPRPHTTAEWRALTPERWVDDIEQVRQSLGAERIILFGHSFGGAIAQEYALRHPDHVAGLLLCSTWPRFDYGDAATALALARATPAQLESLQRLMGTRIEDDDTFAPLVRSLLPLYFHRPDPALIDRAFANVRYSSLAYARSFQECLPELSTLERLPSLAVPTLVLNGIDDWIAPLPHAGERLCDLIPGVELVVLERSGHMPFLEEPEALRGAILSWIGHRIPEALAASLTPTR